MPLESGTYISDLVTTNPTSTDPKSQGDDHLRLLKTVLKNTLAGFTGLVIATGSEAQGSTVNEFVVTVSPSPSAYTTAFILLFIASHSNSGAATIKINSLSSVPLLSVDNSALESTDIESGAVVAAFYNGGNFYLASGNDRVARNGDTYTGAHDATSATFRVATQSAKDGSTKSASTKYVDDADALKADLSSPALTGNPTAPTQAITDNSNKLATTAFAVQLAFRAALPAMSSPGFLYTDGITASWDLVTHNAVFTGGAITLPNGPTSDQPLSPTIGMIRQNTTLGRVENWDGSKWGPLGLLLQAPIHASYNNTVSSSSTGFADTGLYATITPVKANSKILVIVNQAGVSKSANIGAGVNLNLYVAPSTVLIGFGKLLGWTNSAIYNMVTAGTTYLYQVSSLSPLTFRTQFASSDGSLVYVQSQNDYSTITLLEIGS